MDIHKPTPWNGWREFLKECAIILVGMLPALFEIQPGAIEFIAPV